MADPARSEAGTVATRARALGAAGLERQAEALIESLLPGSGRKGRQSPLTAREREVLRHVAGGLTNRQLANRLSVSEHTIHRHLGNIFTKLGLTSRAAAVAFPPERNRLKSGMARTGHPGWWLTSDNPVVGVDSRHRGPVPDPDVLAVVLARVWPRPRPWWAAPSDNGRRDLRT